MALIFVIAFIDFPSCTALAGLIQLIKLHLDRPHTAQDRFLKPYAAHHLLPWSEIYFSENRLDRTAYCRVFSVLYLY